MNSQKGRKDQGPQGTQVFSRDEVSRIVSDAADEQGAVSRAELTGVSDEVSGRTFALGSARVIVGRAGSCDIRLDDSSVSSEHARLTHDADGWRVVNLLSTNGTFVNDEKVSNRSLNNGDRVRFGCVEFRFHGPNADTPGSSKRWLLWVLAVAGLAAVAAGVVLLL